MNYNYLEEACQLNDELVAYRRYLHANPELGLSLPGTKAYVMKALSDFGYQPLEYGESGVAVLAGGKKPGKVFLIRADMDALPIEEESGVPYASRIKGRMHTCGHDNHTAMLLGAAKLLKRHEDEIEGTVKILFQPGEETLEGAKAMIEAGILENPHVDAALMFHDIAGSPVKEGTVGVFGPGAVYASSGRFEIHIKGVGGHGAAPDWTHNPLGAMCAIYQGIHEIVAEHRSPFDSCTMTVGKMSAGDSANIIPETAIMQGTIRTFSKQVGERLRKDLVTLVEYVGKAKGVTAEVTFGTACPPLVVDSNVHKSFLCSMKEMFGDEAWDMRTAWGELTAKAQVPRIFPISPKRFLPALAGYSLGTAVRDASGDVIIPRYSLMMPIFTGARLLILRRQWIGCWKMQRQERYRTVSGRQKRLFMRWPEIDGGCPLKG